MLDINNLNLLSVATICKRLGISRTTFGRWVRNTQEGATKDTTFPLPCTKIGNSPKWRVEVVNAWLNNSKAPIPLIDFQQLVPQIIQDAKRIHQAYEGIDDDLIVLICGADNKACDQIRSRFEEGVGNVFVKAHIRFYFIPGDAFEADNLHLIRGNTVVRCLLPSGYMPSPAVQKAIHNSMVTSAAAVERKVERLILEIPLQ